MTIVRTLIPVAAAYHGTVFQMDVKNAYLNGLLTQEIYMTSPRDFIIHHTMFVDCIELYIDSNKPLMLDLTTYPVQWRHWLFLKFSWLNTILLLYPWSHTSSLCWWYACYQWWSRKHTVSQDLSQFPIWHERSWSFELLLVAYTPQSYVLSQMKYLGDVLHRAGLTDSKIFSTPLELNQTLSTSNGTPLPDPIHYRQVVGSLVYLTSTRPDTAYLVQVVSLSSPLLLSIGYCSLDFAPSSKNNDSGTNLQW